MNPRGVLAFDMPNELFGNIEARGAPVKPLFAMRRAYRAGAR